VDGVCLIGHGGLHRINERVADVGSLAVYIEVVLKAPFLPLAPLWCGLYMSMNELMLMGKHPSELLAIVCSVVKAPRQGS